MSDDNTSGENEIDIQNAVSIDPLTRTSFAQSVAFAVHNEVDAIRNQNTVNLVVMGSAYAKWLENPTMRSEFETIVKESTLPHEPIFGSGSPLDSGEGSPGTTRLATSLLSRFLQK